ncbi:hypothetical protein PIB30_050343, partial [Stylosanthes scabra]|nr:hypothetical protein [Stylosanthes scabra]
GRSLRERHTKEECGISAVKSSSSFSENNNDMVNNNNVFDSKQENGLAGPLPRRSLEIRATLKIFVEAEVFLPRPSILILEELICEVLGRPDSSHFRTRTIGAHRGADYDNPHIFLPSI